MSSASDLSSSLPKQYDPSQVEPLWLARWLESGIFHSEPDKSKKPYTIVIPPPNVTGILHMGHALNNTLQDILIRYARLSGFETLWVPGIDHAGIATQNVVERSLAEEGSHRELIGREKFIDRVWEWKERYGSTILTQLKRLGCSCDWERTRFTMDSGLSRSVREVFVKLYNDGLIYRGRRLINWCVRCHTALADDEIEHIELDGNLWHIRYPLKGRPGHLVVSTTRPETMLGDTALAVNPRDERYRDYIGMHVILPIVNREIPIIADEMVDPEFGTGVVKITPAHDPNDFECGLRHDLSQIVVIGTDGRMTKEAGKYADLDRFRCRQCLVEELSELNYLEGVHAHSHAVGHCYRCDSVIEPYLSEQWFVKMRPLADRALRASREGKLKFSPSRWERVYISWLENVRDWCISRQIWWGHRIPVWYCNSCSHTSASVVDLVSCSSCGSTDISQDPDVLDTWFSSALWPFSTLGWPDKTLDLSYYYPTNVLVTARDIIYFWVARMVMLGLHFMDELPFSEVYINGTILDENGARMSKSRENGIDPLVMINGGTQRRFGKDFSYEGYGADAVRFTLCSLTTEGQDIKLAPTRFEMGRNFINKLWNASRFVLLRLSSLSLDTDPVNYSDLPFADKWILSRLTSVISDCDSALRSYRFHDYSRLLYDFTWGDFCDWYLELVKPVLSSGGPDSLRSGKVLAWVLDNILRLLHPVAPFFTEEVWSLLGVIFPSRGLEHFSPASSFITRSSWPEVNLSYSQPDINLSMERVQEIVRSLRNIRAKFNISPKVKLSATVSTFNSEYSSVLSSLTDVIESQAGISGLIIGENLSKPDHSASEILTGAQIFVPLADLMDVELEKRRISKELSNKEQALTNLNRKLSNMEFLSKAPAHIVAQEEARKSDLTRQISELQDLQSSFSDC